MLLEEASGDVGVRAEQSGIQQDLQACAELAVLLRRLDGAVKQLQHTHTHAHNIILKFMQSFDM